jgi:hypothetical protein
MCDQANNAGQDRGCQILRDRSGFTTDGTDSSWAHANLEPFATQGSVAGRADFSARRVKIPLIEGGFKQLLTKR